MSHFDLTGIIHYHKLMIIDSHTHISLMTKRESFELAKQKLLQEMQDNRISKAFVIPDNVPNSQCADLENVIILIKNEPQLFLIAAYQAKQLKGDKIKRLKELFATRQAYGFKIFPGHDLVYPTDKRWLPALKLCQKYNLPFIIHTGINSGNRLAAKYNDPKHIIKLAENYKNLKIIIAHYFWPKLDYCFKMTQGFDNIYFDTSGLADSEVVEMSGGIKKIKEILTKTIKRRKESVLFGTDWPMGKIKPHLNLINSLKISRDEKNNILYKNAVRVFGIK